MPTHDPNEALDLSSSRLLIERATTGRSAATGLGLEIEVFPMAIRPLRRVSLTGQDGTLARLASAPDLLETLDPGQQIGQGGWTSGGGLGARVSFEPGGQLEISTHYQHCSATAMDASEVAAGQLASVLARDSMVLAAVGVDLWAAGTVSQQLTAPRYPAMDRYLAARGPSGRTMMRDTCALQLNLDLADGLEARDRWMVTNLLAPVATATFATSPTPDGTVRSLRSLNWQQVDPSRTGFPRRLTDPRLTLADQLEQFAMDADVLLVTDVTGRMIPGRPGWRFADWMAHGHPQLGWPTVDDLAVHLTTLFPEVRPRGFLEIRSIDALPARWRRVPAVLYAGATYDPRARERILDVLSTRSMSLERQLRTAATIGLSDPASCALAVEVWSFALQGAARLPTGTFGDGDLALAERFLDRYTLRGRSPADELAELLRSEGPTAALSWAAEPVAAGTAATASMTRAASADANGTLHP